MSLEIALARAEYRHLVRLSMIAARHYERSGRTGYLERFEALIERRSEVRRRCKFNYA